MSADKQSAATPATEARPQPRPGGELGEGRAPRVLFVIGQLGGGGAERQLAMLLEHRRSRFEPHCFLLNDGGVWRDFVEQRSASLRVARYGAPPLRAIEFMRYVRSVQPDVIHAWHDYTAVYPLLSRFLHRRPVIASLRGDPTMGNFEANRVRPRFLGLLSRADLVVSNSPFTLEVLERNGVPVKRSEVIPNGVRVPPAVAPRPPGPTPQVVGLGSLLPKKNWAQLIRVCGRLRRAGHSLSLAIYGEGSHRAALESLCSDQDLDPRTVLPGYVERLPERLQQADVLVHPSLTEGLPNAILEGLAAGLPVVASDLDICRQLALQGDFLRVYPVGDDAACMGALQAVLDAPEARVEWGRRARRFIETTYDCDAVAARYAALYDQMAGSARPVAS